MNIMQLILPKESNLVLFLKHNPISYVPVLVDDDIVITDSFAILMYLEEKYPQHPLLHHDLQRSNQLPGCRYCFLKHTASSEYSCTALEKLLKDYAKKYATGDEVHLADLFLAPQIHAEIKRFHVDMTQFPILSRLNEAYNEPPAFLDAMPEKQPDTPVEALT